jgi:hypothetical protein
VNREEREQSEKARNILLDEMELLASQLGDGIALYLVDHPRSR